jgi:hypothetical protein
MSAMERPTAGRPAVADPRRPQADADTYERDPQIRSLILPGLVSVPPLPAWLRKRFRRTDTHASR